jgi:hypothetical protein
MIGVLQISCNGTLLADGTNANGRALGGVALNGRRVIQVAEPLRASDVLVFGRGNRRKEIKFRILKAFSGNAAAFAAAHAQDDAIPDQANLILTLDDGVDIAIVTFQNAGWESVGMPGEREINGISVVTEYSVIAGAAAVTLDPSGSEGPGTPVTTGWPLPLVADSIIDPLIIPNGGIATVTAGNDLFARAIVNNGVLILAGGGQIALA